MPVHEEVPHQATTHYDKAVAVWTAERLIMLQRLYIKYHNMVLAHYETWMAHEGARFEAGPFLHSEGRAALKEDTIRAMKLFHLLSFQDMTLVQIKAFVQDFIHEQGPFYTLQGIESDKEHRHGELPKNKRFTKHIIDILEKCFLLDAYPSEQEKEQIAEQCHMRIKQVNNWFTNKRNRAKAQMEQRLISDRMQLQYYESMP